MAVIEELDENLTRLIYAEKYIAIKYYTDNCESCRALAPVFEKFSMVKKYSEIVFVKIEASGNPVASEYIGRHQATIMVSYKDGLLINSTTVATEKELKAFLDELIENKS